MQNKNKENEIYLVVGLLLSEVCDYNRFFRKCDLKKKSVCLHYRRVIFPSVCFSNDCPPLFVFLTITTLTTIGVCCTLHLMKMSGLSEIIHLLGLQHLWSVLETLRSVFLQSDTTLAAVSLVCIGDTSFCTCLVPSRFVHVHSFYEFFFNPLFLA